jgi:hypothetical protein
MQQCRVADRRRRLSHPWLNLHSLRGRRRRHRREADGANPDLPLDWHQPHLLFITLAILLLCGADAHNTLQLLLWGAREINLLMALLIEEDPRLFLAVKLAMTGTCLIVLVAYQHFVVFNRLRIRHVLYSIFGLYLGLIAYELAIWPGRHLAIFVIPM